MTWPKKDTRKITIDGQLYLWHLNSDWFYHNEWIVIKQAGTQGQLLLVNPYHHDLPMGPKTVQMAVEFAHSVGWTPSAKKPPIKLRYNGDHHAGEAFTILPTGATIG
jgi:hypothetical protein